MRIAVAGATGAVGRRVAAIAEARGHEVVPLSRSRGADVVTGRGVAPALAGAAAVIDASGTRSLGTAAATRFFTAATRTLLAAEREAGVAHHVALSIVGAAGVDDGYYAGKAAQEREILARPDGWSLLRTTQFHEFVPQTVARASVAGAVLAPRLRCRPVAAEEVAAELVRIAEAGPSGLQPDLAGPREEHLPDLVRRLLAARGRRPLVVGVTLPGRIGRAMRDGGLLPGPGARFGAQDFDGWLATHGTAG